MPSSEKRKLLVKEIQEVPDHCLDELLVHIQQLKNHSSDTDSIAGSTFEQLLQSTSDQYKEVWKVLA
ncbi:hypothetical protein QNI19_15325 [Cytophagaceae bacterium DM2B3-1]|uniref:Uncharacterized protein n=1 Tax=Xanthocytophaga flava TaxID=3048013 RepID=A0ABT7CKN0_9BACT|nr:hypothetical protein [Xanthocytophaga flavus]MDJ1469800.1 hypothetical protein [Xanthocytophaga flavus]MDJ1494313.1 hypothetical protein [Xanthocytophaga flavus]